VDESRQRFCYADDLGSVALAVYEEPVERFVERFRAA